MNDNELMKNLDEYRQEHNLEWQEIAKILKVNRVTVSNWNAGTPISAKNRKGIKLLVSSTEDMIGDCFLDHCPAKPPVDRLMQFVLESWAELDNDDRAKVIALISNLKEKKSIPEDVDCDERGA